MPLQLRLRMRLISMAAARVRAPFAARMHPTLPVSEAARSPRIIYSVVAREKTVRGTAGGSKKDIHCTQKIYVFSAAMQKPSQIASTWILGLQGFEAAYGNVISADRMQSKKYRIIPWQFGVFVCIDVRLHREVLAEFTPMLGNFRTARSCSLRGSDVRRRTRSLLSEQGSMEVHFIQCPRTITGNDACISSCKTLALRWIQYVHRFSSPSGHLHPPRTDQQGSAAHELRV